MPRLRGSKLASKLLMRMRVVALSRTPENLQSTHRSLRSLHMLRRPREDIACIEHSRTIEFSALQGMSSSCQQMVKAM